MIDNEARQITLVLPGMTCYGRDRIGWCPGHVGDYPLPPVPFPKAD